MFYTDNNKELSMCKLSIVRRVFMFNFVSCKNSAFRDDEIFEDTDFHICIDCFGGV